MGIVKGAFSTTLALDDSQADRYNPDSRMTLYESERRRNVILMFYFLELPDAEIAEILNISRNSVYRNRMCSLKLIRDMYEEEL